jgi:hypothetical protein
MCVNFLYMHHFRTRKQVHRPSEYKTDTAVYTVSAREDRFAQLQNQLNELQGEPLSTQ